MASHRRSLPIPQGCRFPASMGFSIGCLSGLAPAAGFPPEKVGERWGREGEEGEGEIQPAPKTEACSFLQPPLRGATSLPTTSPGSIARCSRTPGGDSVDVCIPGAISGLPGRHCDEENAEGAEGIFWLQLPPARRTRSETPHSPCGLQVSHLTQKKKKFLGHTRGFL